MKKISIFMLFCLFLFTGCEENRLVCTKIEESDEFKSETKYTFTFSKDGVKKATMKSTGILLGDFNNATTIAEYKSTADASASEYNEVEGITAQVSSNKNKVTLTVNILAASLNDENKELYGMNADKEELWETFEENGYTCK